MPPTRVLSNKLVDIGINLCDKSFASRDMNLLFQESTAHNLSHLILTASSFASFYTNMKIISKHLGSNGSNKSLPHVSTTLGIHPHSAKSAPPNFKQKMRNTLAQYKEHIVAIGECGLDYNRMFSPQDVQIKVFREHMQIAGEFNLPVFLHCRDAHADFVSVLREFPSVTKKCVHCFTSDNRSELDDFLALHCSIGITGWCCDERRGKGLAELLHHIPLEKLMLETDGPYLLPRNIPKPWPKINEPKYLPWVVKKVAEETGKEEEEIAKITTKNAMDFFSLPPS